MSGDVCKCGRPKYTDEDLARWQEEAEDSAEDERFNPEWAKAICWTMRGVPCVMKPIKGETT